MLKTQAEFLRKIKAPAGTYTALPCLTNAHFVCLMHILHAQYTFLYTKYTFYTKCTFYLYQIYTFLKSEFFEKKHSKNVVLHNPDLVIFVIGVFGRVFRR